MNMQTNSVHPPKPEFPAWRSIERGGQKLEILFPPTHGVVVDATAILAVLLRIPPWRDVLAITRKTHLVAPSIVRDDVEIALQRLFMDRQITWEQEYAARTSFNLISIEHPQHKVGNLPDRLLQNDIPPRYYPYIFCAWTTRHPILTFDQTLQLACVTAGAKVISYNPKYPPSLPRMYASISLR